jgi:hypothetical protein
MNAAHEEGLRKGTPARQDVSESRHSICYNERRCKCARKSLCLYGGDITEGQLQWNSTIPSKQITNKHHLRCLSDTLAMNFVLSCHARGEGVDLTNESLIERYLGGFQFKLNSDDHRAMVKEILIRLFEKRPISVEHNKFFNLIDGVDRLPSAESDSKTKKLIKSAQIESEKVVEKKKEPAKKRPTKADASEEGEEEDEKKKKTSAKTKKAKKKAAASKK